MYLSACLYGAKPVTYGWLVIFKYINDRNKISSYGQ